MRNMRNLIAGLWLAATLASGTAFAQQNAPFNEAGVTMGHWHLVSQDVAANIAQVGSTRSRRCGSI